MLIAVSTGQHLQDNHQQQIPSLGSSSLQLRIYFLQLGSQNLANSVLDEAHLADDVTFGYVYLGIGALGRMGSADVIHVGGVIIVELGLGCSSPELGQVVGAAGDIPGLSRHLFSNNICA